MSTELFANNAESTIDNAGGITSTGTSITLPSGDGAKFPAAVTGVSQFRALLYDTSTSAIVEYLTVTNRSTDTLTVTRESEDATRFPKAARAQGVKVVAIASAQVLQGAVAAGGGDYFRSGYYSTGMWESGAFAGTLTMNTNAVRAVPFVVPVRRAFDRIAVNIVTAASAGGVLRMGIYSDGGGKPGALLVDAGTVSSTSTGTAQVTISQTLDPGLYWLAAVGQVASCGVTAHASSVSSPHVNYVTAPPSTIFGVLYLIGGVSGALPNPFTAADQTNGLSAPVLTLRAA